MKFVYTQADMKQKEVVISGYFAADNDNEAVLLREMAKTTKNGKVGEHLDASNNTVAFKHIQESLLKMNVTRIKQMMDIADFKYVLASNFKGDMSLIK